MEISHLSHHNIGQIFKNEGLHWGWVVGVILCAALSTPTANFLTSGDYVEVFGFIYGMGGITLAKMLIKAIEKKSKVEIESKTGVKLDDDAS